MLKAKNKTKFLYMKRSIYRKLNKRLEKNQKNIFNLLQRAKQQENNIHKVFFSEKKHVKKTCQHLKGCLQIFLRKTQNVYMFNK